MGVDTMTFGVVCATWALPKPEGGLLSGGWVTLSMGLPTVVVRDAWLSE